MSGDMDADRVKLERRQLVILGARLDQFNRGEISLKKVVDDGYVLVGALTILPLFWKDTVMELLGDLDVSLGLSSDSSGSSGEGLGPKDVAIAETIWALDKVVEEGRRRLELLNGPLSRFAFDDPLMTQEDLVTRYPSGSEVMGTITQLMSWGAFVDFDAPFLGVVRAFKFDLDGRQVGDTLPLVVLELQSERLHLKLKHSESDQFGPFAVDVLRVQVRVDTSQEYGRREVLIFVNEVEMTSQGAGMGMSPRVLLVPTNQLRVEDSPKTVAVGCCTCGVEGCGSTDVRIEGDGSFVYWDWQKNLPAGRRMVFDRAAYDAALDAIDADRSWVEASRNVARWV